MALARTATAYRNQLFALLPPGVVWSDDPASTLQRVLDGSAQEFARVDGRALALLTEVDPRYADELFPDWEGSYGLPSECAPDDQSLADRRAALIARIVGRGGMRPQDYINLCDGLGYDDSTIIEQMEATVELGNGAGPSGAEIGDPMNGEDWLYAWDVRVHSNTVRQSVINGSEIGDALRSWGDDLLICTLHKAAPSWLLLNIGYLEA